MEAWIKSGATEEDYLAYELAHDGRHEFMDGYILAMAGAMPTHLQIVGNILAALHRPLRERGCSISASDQRVKVMASGVCTYPDLVVVCGKPQYTNSRPPSLTNPTTIIEVLSDTTARNDLTWKRRQYALIESLQAYHVIDWPACVSTFYRNDPTKAIDVTEGSVSIAGIELPLAEIYEGVAALEHLEGTTPNPPASR